MPRSRAHAFATCAHVFGYCALSVVTALSAAVTAPAAVRAQEYDVSRRMYTFYDDRLEIEVLATAPGELQILHGEAGRLEVAAHASSGLAASALSSDRTSVLRLTALGARSAEYVVIVPERTDVRVKLPGRSSWSNASRYSASTFRWDSTPEPPEVENLFPQPTLEGRYFLGSSRATPPSRLRLLHPEHIRSIEIRLEGTDFNLASTRPLTNSPGAPDLLDIDPGSDDVDLVVQVPSFTRNFELVIGDQSVLRVQKGVVSAPCAGGMHQQTSKGAQRYKYLPASGMNCGSGGS